MPKQLHRLCWSNSSVCYTVRVHHGNMGKGNHTDQLYQHFPTVHCYWVR